MPSNEIEPYDSGKFLALNHSTEEIQEIIADNLGGQEVGEFDLTRLTVPAGGATSWELDDPVSGVQSIREIEGIIVHVTQTRSWWPTEIGQGESVPPSCSSPDAKVGFGKQWATPEDPNPDGEPRRLACAECPHAQWGSGKNGGQACQLKGQWFLLREGSFLPLVVTLPAMSLKPAKKYMLGLAGSGIRYSAVVTKLHLEKEQRNGNTFAKVVPEMVAPLSPDDAAKARAYGELLRPLFDSVARGEVVDGTVDGDEPGGAPVTTVPKPQAPAGGAVAAPEAA